MKWRNKLLIHHARIRSAIVLVILMGMNALIFCICMKLTRDLQSKGKISRYEQQIKLYKQYLKETELSLLQFRDTKHNMKHHLISILAYAEKRDYEKIIEFVNSVMKECGMIPTVDGVSGNIDVDPLISYWKAAAKKKGIAFSADIQIPVTMPFQGTDLCLILGNLLENAVEAAQNAEENKYIVIKIKYDKNNLLLSVTNSYRGELLKIKNQRLKSTKSDVRNHGVGLSSVYRTAAKYHGTVMIEDSVPEQFKIRVLLYGRQE